MKMFRINTNTYNTKISFKARSKTVAMAGITPQDFSKLLESLAVVILKLRRNRIGSANPQDLNVKRPIFDANKPVCLKVLKAIGCDIGLFNELSDHMLDKPAEVLTYSQAFVKDFRKKIRENRIVHDSTSVNSMLASMLNPMMTLLSSPESYGSYTNLAKQISGLKVKSLINAFNSDSADNFESAKDLNETIKSLLKKLGVKGVTITGEEREKFKTDPKKAALLKEYDKVNKEKKFAIRNNVGRIVQESGKDHIPLKQLSKQLADEGQPNHLHPDLRNATNIHINGDSLLTDSTGRTLDMHNAAPISNGVATKVIVNKAYDPKNPSDRGNSWLFKIMDAKTGRRIGKPAYASDVSADNKKEAFEHVNEGIENIDELKQNWREDFNDGNGVEDPVRTYAFFTEFLYWTAMRPGTKEAGETRGVQTFGGANFLVRHLKISNGKMIIKIPVKGGQTHTYVINENDPHADKNDKIALKKLFAYMAAKIKNKQPNDIVFTVEKHRMNTDKFNQYLKSKEVPFTGHKFRLFRGTELGKKVLEEATIEFNKAKKAAGGKELPNKTVTDIFNRAMLEVGKALGHMRGQEPTATTAIKYYTDPNLMVQWFKKIGYAPHIHSGVKDAARRAKVPI